MLLIPRLKRKIEPTIEIKPRSIFKFAIWVNNRPEAITIGASVSKGMQATFAPERLPCRRVSEIISRSMGPGANPDGAPSKNPAVKTGQILSITMTFRNQDIQGQLTLCQCE